MASPQKENGYVALANEIVEKLCQYRLPGQEWQILWVILRKTYGWNKKMDRISLSQYSEMTGMPRSKCHQVLKSLINKNIVIKGVPQKGNTTAISYGIQKDFDKWKLFPKKVTVPQKGNRVFPKKGTKVFPKKVTTKDNKPSIQKTREFLDYFNLKTGKKYSLTSERQRLINRRLKNHTIDHLKRAVDNFTRDDWPDRYKYMDIVYCIGTIRGIDNLEKWLNYESKPAKKKDPITVSVAMSMIARDQTTRMMEEVLERLPDDQRQEFELIVAKKDKYMKEIYRRAKDIIEKKAQKAR